MSAAESTFKNAVPGAEHLEATTARFDRLLDAVYPVLNRLHGFEGSRRFWAILLYRDLLKQIEKGANERLERLERNQDVGSSHVPDLIRDAWRDAPYLPGEAMRRATIAYLLRGSIASSRSIVMGFHHLHIIAKCVEQPASFLTSEKWRGTIDATARPALEEMAKNLEFPLARITLQSLSSKYVEEFRSLYGAVDVTDPCNKEFHASFLPGINMRMTIARHVEEGSRLNIYQHAATYGEVHGHVKHHIESGFADRFRTWGWTLRENDEPHVALRLMQPAQLMFRSKPSAESWLYIIVRQPRPSLLETTHGVQKRFFGALRDERTAKIVIRPRLNKGGLVERQLINGLQTRVQAIDNGASRMVDLVKDAELVILDNFPSTAFMECLIADVPVIGIIPEGTQFTSIATQFYDEFHRLGLLHHIPDSAARFLNRLNVRSWWREEVAGLDCIREYLRTFCNRDVSKLRT